MTTTINASNSGSGGLIQTADASGVLALQTAGTTAVTINASQNVGIGTASPTNRLEVVSPINTTAYVKVSTTGTGVSYLGLTAGAATNELSTNNSGDFVITSAGVAGDVVKMVHAGAVTNTLVLSGGNVLLTGGGKLSLYGTPPNVGIDGTNSTVTITNGNSIDFTSFSGTLMVTERNTTGSSAILLCGGTSTTVVGQTNGTNFTNTSGSGNIRWFWNAGSSSFRLQNNIGSTLVFNIVVVKTRDSP